MNKKISWQRVSTEFHNEICGIQAMYLLQGKNISFAQATKILVDSGLIAQLKERIRTKKFPSIRMDINFGGFQ